MLAVPKCDLALGASPGVPGHLPQCVMATLQAGVLLVKHWKEGGHKQSCARPSGSRAQQNRRELR